jgi:hypothetical protein
LATSDSTSAVILTLASLPDREWMWLHRLPGGAPATAPGEARNPKQAR